MNNWRDTTLRELVRIEHGFAFKGAHFSDHGELVVLTPGNFHETGGFRARPEKDRYYHARFPERYLLKKGDLIVAMTEQGEGLLGSAAIIPESGKYLHNQRLGLVKPNPKTADQRFLYYIFNSDHVRQQIRNSSSGSKVRHTSPERMYRSTVRVPDKRGQSETAAVLTAYDDLIEANQRRIALLERMAEEIYREWFVRLRFPGYAKTKLVKGVPAGWSVRPLGSVMAEVKNGIRLSELTAEQRYIGLEHIPRRSISLREWATADSVESNKLSYDFRSATFCFLKSDPICTRWLWPTSQAFVRRTPLSSGPRIGRMKPSFFSQSSATHSSNSRPSPRTARFRTRMHPRPVRSSARARFSCRSGPRIRHQPANPSPG